MRVLATSFNISCPSIPGLSGSAVVCDGSGGVIGYCGGAQSGSDDSPFGAYGFQTSLILHALRRQVEENLMDEDTK